MRRENQLKALQTANTLSRYLRIPPEYLKGSGMRVDGSVAPDEKIWYELFHDGTQWTLVQENECVYYSDGCQPTDVERIILREKALGWLLALAIQNPNQGTEA